MLKKHLFLVLAVALLSACATNSYVHKSDNYTANTKVYSVLTEASRQVVYNVPGNYDEYFPIVKTVTTNYQLIYHHPGDYTTDTHYYYVVLVDFPSKNENLSVNATYNGKSLPVAVQYVKFLSSQNYVNILLTKEDLIYAYENVGKLIIPLVAEGRTYNIIFPDYYLRNVLAKTTNIGKYKIAEQLANPPAPAPIPQAKQEEIKTYNKPLREPFEYSRTFSELNLGTLGDAVRYSFNLVSSYPCDMNLAITADLQEYYFDVAKTKKDYYIKAISAKEMNLNEKSCDKIELDGDQLLNVKWFKNGDSSYKSVYLDSSIKEDMWIKNLRKSKI